MLWCFFAIYLVSLIQSRKEILMKMKNLYSRYSEHPISYYIRKAWIALKPDIEEGLIKYTSWILYIASIPVAFFAGARCFMPVNPEDAPLIATENPFIYAMIAAIVIYLIFCFCIGIMKIQLKRKKK